MLELTLRAGEYDTAQMLFEQFFQLDRRRSGGDGYDRGVQIQACAVMAREKMDDRSLEAAAAAWQGLQDLQTGDSPHHTAAERGGNQAGKLELFKRIFELTGRIGNCAMRAQVLLDLNSVNTGRQLSAAGSPLSLGVRGALTNACHLWIEQLPGDAALDAFLSGTSDGVRSVRADLDIYSKSGGLYMGPEIVRALLKRTEPSAAQA